MSHCISGFVRAGVEHDAACGVEPLPRSRKSSQARGIFPSQAKRRVGDGKAGISQSRIQLSQSSRIARHLATAFLTLLCLLALTPTLASALSEGRVYERVSPAFKGGQGVGVLMAVAPDGESVAFGSLGVFGGVSWASEGESSYLARRGPAGWATSALSSPPGWGGVFRLSTTLEYALTNGSPEATHAGEPTIGNAYALHRTDAPGTAQAWDLKSWEIAGNYVLTLPPPDEFFQKGLFLGASANLCHIVIGLSEGPLLPEAEGTTQGTQLYDLASAPAGGCHGDGSRPLRLLSVKNTLGPHGEPESIDGGCFAEPGAVYVSAQTGGFNRFPAGGEEIFFTQRLGTGCLPHQLFVRLGGERTLEVSRPLSEVCNQEKELPCPDAATRAGADFAGASEDGSKVFFTTTAPLEPATDKDNGNDLYMATISCPPAEPECAVVKRDVTSLVQVSHDPAAGEAAEVQGVVIIASDGSHVYFVAHGVLSEAANAQGQTPVKGAENLYVYDTRSASTKFVAMLSSADTKLWGLGQEAQSNACHRPAPAECVDRREPGRYLVFSSYAPLVAGDTDTAKDVYRYDAQTGALQRVSLGEGGYDANGNRNGADATIQFGGISNEYEMSGRAISEDGSRIVFSAVEPLSPAAINGLANVYEWHEGGVSLISSGSSLTQDGEAVISPSGRDVFFLTSARLVRQDTDENVDLYDARLEGGFPAAPVEEEVGECSGDACQSPLSAPAPLLGGTATQAPGGNLPSPTNAAVPKKLTQAQQLARALKACAKKPKNRRAACRRSARKQYAKAAKRAGRGGR
jgi:hypothetical protein